MVFIRSGLYLTCVHATGDKGMKISPEVEETWLEMLICRILGLLRDLPLLPPSP